MEDLGAAATWQQEALCSVCLELLDDPVMLDCGHNVCAACISRLCEAERRASSAENNAFSSVRCPECRQPTPLPAEGSSALKRNLTLRNLVQRLRAEQQPANEAIPVCGICEETPATAECQECGFEICEQCQKTQHQKGRYKRHTVLPLGTLAKQRPRRCPAHGKDLDLFCREEQQPICIYCLQLGTGHRTHTVVPIGDAIRETQEQLDQLVKQVALQRDSLRRAMTDTERLTSEMRTANSAVRNEIQTWSAAVIEAVRAREAALLRQVGLTEEQAVQELSSRAVRNQTWDEQISETLAKCEHLVQRSPPTELLRHHTVLQNRLRSLLCDHSEEEQCVTSVSTCEFLADTSVCELISAAGSVVAKARRESGNVKQATHFWDPVAKPKAIFEDDISEIRIQLDPLSQEMPKGDTEERPRKRKLSDQKTTPGKRWEIKI